MASWCPRMTAYRCALPLSLISSMAAPPELPVEISWSAPPSCPQESEFVTSVADLVGLEDGPRLDLRASISLSEAPPFAMRIELATPGGTEIQALEAESCTELVEAGSLLLATRILEARASAREAALRLANPFERPLPPTPAPRPRAPNLGNPPHVAWTGFRKPALTLAGLGGVVFGLGPRPNFALRAQLDLRWTRFGIAIVGQHAFASREEVAGGTYEVGASAGAALLCHAFRRQRTTIPLCAGVELSAMQGRAVPEDPDANPRAQLRVGIPVECGVSWRASARLGIRLQTGINVAATQPGFTAEAPSGQSIVFRTPDVAGYALLGIEVNP